MTETLSPAASRSPEHRSRHWFSDLSLSWRGLRDRRTGRIITARDLTPQELAKFLGYFGAVLMQGAIVRFRTRHALRIWFTPERPPPWYVVWSAMALSGCRFARSETEADLSFYFEDKTVASGAPAPAAINGACRDISKSNVARVFEKVAGYALARDPESYFGLLVEKSEENGAHDGHLVSCPTRPLPGKAYQRFVDSSDGEDAVDLRTTIINRKPLFVLIKTKPRAARFSIHNKAVVYRNLADVYSESEIALLTRFAETMQLDWASIDVLRDSKSGRIYIVDVNKTDTGPPVDLSGSDRTRLKSALARAFAGMVQERLAAKRKHP